MSDGWLVGCLIGLVMVDLQGLLKADIVGGAGMGLGAVWGQGVDRGGLNDRGSLPRRRVESA